MPLIGQGVNAALGRVDYSPFVESSWQLANANARAFGEATGAVKDVFDKRKKDKEAVKTGQAKLAAAIELFGDQGGYLAPLRDKILDEDLPISERAALAGTANEMLALGIDKFNTDRQFQIQERGLAITEAGAVADRDAYAAKSGFENQTALDEGINKMIAAQELAEQFKLPVSEAMIERFQQAIDSGNGVAVKSVADEYLAMVRPQAEAATKGGGKKLSTIATTLPDGRAGEMNVFVDPSGAISDIYGTPINPEAFLPETEAGSVLPPKDGAAWGDGSGGGSLPPVNEGRRIPPMPLMTIGQRAVGGQSPQTPAQARKEELEIKMMESQLAGSEADLAKQAAMKESAGASATEALALMDKLEAHPGFKAAVGTSFAKTAEGVAGALPFVGEKLGEAAANVQTGTDRRGAEAIINQLKGQAFLNAIQQLRGLGALSDAEGAKLQQAAARLDTTQSEADFKTALNDYRKIVRDALGRLGATAPAKMETEEDAVNQLRAFGQ